MYRLVSDVECALFAWVKSSRLCPAKRNGQNGRPIYSPVPTISEEGKTHECARFSLRSCPMTDTPIYDRLRAELLHADLPASDDHLPPDAAGAQPIDEPRHCKHAGTSSADETVADRSHQAIDHGENDDSTRCCSRG